jgi:hypothetical protein
MREDASTIQRMVNAGGTEHFDEEGTAERARGMDAKDEEPKPAAKPAADDKPAPAAAAQTPDPARKVPPAPGTKRMTISRSSVPKQVDPKRGKPAAKSAPKVKAKAPAKPKDKAKKKSR